MSKPETDLAETGSDESACVLLPEYRARFIGGLAGPDRE